MEEYLNYSQTKKSDRCNKATGPVNSMEANFTLIGHFKHMWQVLHVQGPFLYVEFITFPEQHIAFPSSQCLKHTYVMFNLDIQPQYNTPFIFLAKDNWISLN